MINKVHLEQIATYQSAVEFEPKKINFIYGTNGTGKSTLSKLLNNEINSSQSYVKWENEQIADVVVYNKSFVSNNFQSDVKLKGIFTLGEDSIAIKKEIAEMQEEIDSANNKINASSDNYSKLESEQIKLKEIAKNSCWDIQKEYGQEFSLALVGTRGNKEKFFEKFLEKYEVFDNKNLSSIDELRKEYSTIFSNESSINIKYENIQLNNIKRLDNHELLNKKIMGKSDTPIGAFIEYLQASDWVKKGIDYVQKSEGKCPYCQRDLPSNLQEEIESYFDEQYENDKKELSNYEIEYKCLIDELIVTLDEINNNHYPYIDYVEFEQKTNELKSKLEKNIRTINLKLNSLSECFENDSILDISNELFTIIEEFNKEIEKNNDLINYLDDSKDKFKVKLWNFFVSLKLNDIKNYKKNNNGKEIGKQNILKQIKEQEELIKDLKNKITEKELKLTSVKPTVDEINYLLKGFGFTGFLLDVNDEKSGTYKIIRPNGENAIKTLSEGEYNFISFLYFYHLCFGSQTKTGISTNRVLVIDDPISSMDSNVLFIVATLVKNILHFCKENKNGIKQVFILTHNAYFHKEITYLGLRKEWPESEVAFYVLRKKNNQSTIEAYSKNPIHSSYELLWKELKDEKIGSANILLNVMRRILEHYFSVIGGIDYETCVNKFSGSDKLICKSLVSFINDGSHSVFDDLVFTIDDGEIENYKRVFQLVFQKLGHISHYDMMMSRC